MNQKPALNRSQDNMEILGSSRVIRQIRETIHQVAPTNIPVLIEGESGTGKELVARALHRHSRRKDKTMFTVNCGAIPEGILESELFGHQKGAFTGAVEARKGYFEMARGSTLFLDEIGEMPLSTQVKVLRVLEEKEFMRVGGNTNYKADVRIVAATNKNLDKEVRAGNFRQDLYFRLNAVKITVPPLRDRVEDIPILVEKFQSEFTRENRIDFAGFTADAIELLHSQLWPGNVRELRNLVQSVIVLERGQKIDAQILSRHLKPEETTESRFPVPTNKSVDQAERELIYRVLLELKSDVDQMKQLLFSQFMQPKSLQEWRPVNPEHTIQQAEEVKPEEEIKTMQEAGKELIVKTLKKTNWSKRKTAKLLNISERTLYRKINEYNLQEN
ncbi:MAG TPA: sigma-54-dependent Fis family transcriptional regulator [Bacteroidetes bacterium]|nr:sigma-54-dependent Fis family transcriptional regulator [Bacteroidota bacterium]